MDELSPLKIKPYLVYSNSIVEHLGSFENQKLFAAECARVGCCYYVQTPNKWFPIEPHHLAPFVHWLPRWAQRRLIRNFTLRGWLARPSQSLCDDMVDEIRLLGANKMQQLFPDADVWHERILWLSKSLIAVRNCADSYDGRPMTGDTSFEDSGPSSVQAR